MQTVLVTGATGYIGSNLVKKLVQLDKDVSIIIRPSSNLQVLNDVMDKISIYEYKGCLSELTEFLKEIKVDIVFHLASLFIAEHNSNQIHALMESNILFPTNLLEAMKDSGTKSIVNIGTSWQHYKDAMYNPVCLYAATKEAFEKLLEYYVQVESFQAITLKLFDSYGPKDYRNKIIDIFIQNTLYGHHLNMSGGEQKINLTFITDTVDALIKSAELIGNAKNIEHKKYFAYSEETMTLRDLATIFEKISGKKLNICWGKRPYRKREVFEPYLHGEKLLGWQAKISIEEGIKMVLREHAGRGPNP